MKEIKDREIWFTGFALGFILQVILLIEFHSNPFDSPLLLVLPGLPALVMTIYRSEKIWKWLIASTLSLPMAGILTMFLEMPREEMMRLFVRFMGILLVEGFIMSLMGIFAGWVIHQFWQKKYQSIG